MENASIIALSRQLALRRELEVVANNVANVNTPAFKGERLVFVEVLEQLHGQPPALDTLSYGEIYGLYTDFAPGGLQSTGNPLDVAINGAGFFTIGTPDGPRYSRNGRFSLNADGQLVTSDGLPVLGDGGSPIVIDAAAGPVTIAGDGTVATAAGVVARLQLVEFDDTQALTKVGAGLWDAGAQPPRPVADPQMAQGMVEGSNVQPVLEITGMIELMREYERVSRLIEAEARRQDSALDKLARVGR